MKKPRPRVHRVGRSALRKQKRRADAKVWVHALTENHRLGRAIPLERDPYKRAKLIHLFIETERALSIPEDQSRLKELVGRARLSHKAKR